MENHSTDAVNNVELATAAKILGIGRNQLFAVLKEYKVLEKNNAPTRQMIHEGYFTTAVSHYRRRGYEKMVGYYQKPIVTAKGMKFVREIAVSAGLNPTREEVKNETH